jgi:Xaa-Pro aminopeptidase
MPLEEFGIDELYAQGLTRDQIELEIVLRAARRFGIEDAVVPPGFPLELADHLRENGIKLSADRKGFVARRRVKNDAELAGIRRAQRAAEAAMSAARELLRSAERRNGDLVSTASRSPASGSSSRSSRRSPPTAPSRTSFIVSHGAQTAVGHDMGSGPIAPDEPICLDLFPRDRESGCFADMTRTFVVGEPSEELAEYHRLCREALDRSVAAIKAGSPGAS